MPRKVPGAGLPSHPLLGLVEAQKKEWQCSSHNSVAVLGTMAAQVWRRAPFSPGCQNQLRPSFSPISDCAPVWKQAFFWIFLFTYFSFLAQIVACAVVQLCRAMRLVTARPGEGIRRWGAICLRGPPLPAGVIPSSHTHAFFAPKATTGRV